MVALKTLIFSILVPGTVAGVIPWLLLQQPWGLVFMFPSLWLVGILPLLLGVALYLWCAVAFTFIGKGTPAPIDAPKFLVKEGPYHWVRNPMYIAVLSIKEWPGSAAIQDGCPPMASLPVSLQG
jgi:protein-S-isoprenylcysteine O-methyltransferase Ste14